MDRWSILAVLFTARIGMALQFQVVAAVLPFLVPDLGLTYAEAGTLIGLYMLPGVFLAIPTGWLAARYGDKPVVLAGIVLMIVGGVAIALADGFALAAFGRLLGGVGGIFLSVLLTKMTTDWFAGREIATAMAVLVSSWPVGLALAMAAFGWWATVAPWPVTFYATAAFSGLGLALVALFYRPPPRSGAAAAPAAGPGAFRLGGRSLMLSLLAGAVWGVFNVGAIIYVSFAPTFLIGRGAEPANASLAASLMVWLCLPLILLGGRIADRLGRGDLVIAGGALVTALLMAAMPFAPWPLAVLVLIGVVWAAPAGPIMALPQQALRPEERAAGFGVYFTVYNAAMTALPPAAGWIFDLSGGPAAPLVFGAGLMASTALFLLLVRGRMAPEAPAA